MLLTEAPDSSRLIKEFNVMRPINGFMLSGVLLLLWLLYASALEAQGPPVRLQMTATHTVSTARAAYVLPPGVDSFRGRWCFWPTGRLAGKWITLPGGCAPVAAAIPKADTASVPPPPPAPPTGPWHEPAGMTPLTQRPFSCKAINTANPNACAEVRRPLPLVSWDDVESRYGDIVAAQDPTAPVSPPGVLRFLYSARYQGPPPATYSPGVVQTLDQTGKGWRVLYVRYVLRLSPTFYGHVASATNKIAFHRGFAAGSGRRFEPILRLRGAGASALRLSIDCQGCVDNETPLPTGPAVSRGAWHTIEVLLVLNTPGQRDGRITAWLDGQLAIDAVGREITDAPGEWRALHLAPTWGGGGGAIPAEFYWDLDDIYASAAP